MAGKRRSGSKPSYHPRPAAPATSEQERRVRLVRAVLAGEMTISEAAEQLGIARVNMQTLVHRAEAAMIEALAPRPPGPTPTPPAQAKLAAEVERLRAQNETLRRQLEAADAMMGAAGEIIRSLRGLPPRTSSPRSKSSSRSRKAQTPDKAGEDPEPATSVIATALARLTTMPELGSRTARLLGLARRTLSRYLQRLAAGQPLRRRRGGRARPVAEATAARVRTHVRALGGLVGAASLAHTIGDVSRRAAARIKRDELAAIERERQAEAGQVEVTVPGVLRGFDAMHLGEACALVSADASVPYRTAAAAVPAYDGRHVADVLAADFSAHGAPLVLRLDRARCHETAEVLSVLREHGVLLLHGPPRHPQYYGQLERQNREHRAWLNSQVGPDQDDLAALLTRMTSALNRLWRRPTLDWRTAEEVWMQRRPLTENRRDLHQWVQARADQLRNRGLRDDLAMRLAIEQALSERGYLKVTPGRRVLCA